MRVQKLERKDIILMVGLILTTLIICFSSMKVHAFNKPSPIKAFGDCLIDGDGSGVIGDSPSDVVISAEDMYYLYELCR